ncbi:hypothetical protein TrST_g11153 [Triparma strigata]|uniref:C2 domain-containing protein n=1 Tax=Triparma strigata TaxID=1606541 RepID=A0A9W7BMQ5_9STRA|nr:hypothetical protein TrST_g11153 [Triparma strigata]
MTVVEPETTVSDPMKCTRLGVKILDVVELGGTEGSKGAGSELRATVFVGGLHEQVDNSNPLRTQSTSCSSNTSDPRFDTEFFFPLSVETIDDILSGQVAVTLTDMTYNNEDQEGEGTDVGQVKIPFEQIFKGKVLSKCVIVKPSYYKMTKTPSMTRPTSGGRIRMVLSFYPGDDFSAEKMSPDCKTFVELAHSINRTVNAANPTMNVSRGRSMSPNKSRTGRSRSRRGNSRSGSPQKMNRLEKIVLASGAPVNDRYKSGFNFEEEDKIPLPDYTQPDHIPEPEPESIEPEITHIPAPSISPEPSPQKPQPPTKSKSTAPPLASPRAPFAKSTINIHEIISQSTASYSKKAAAAWKNHVLQSLSRLEDKDTLSRSQGEIHQIVLMMQPHQVQPFLYQLSRHPASSSLATRRSILQIVEYTCLVHPQATATAKSMNTIMDIVLSGARGVEDATREGCVSAMSGCMRFSFPNSPYSKCENRLGSLLEDLFSVYSEQQLTTKEAAGNCIAAAIKPLPPMIPIQITGNIRSMEDLRHALRPTKIPIPKETVIIANRMALMFFRGKSAVSAMHQALSSAILPAGYVVERLSDMEKFYLNQSGRKHAKAIEANSEVLISELTAAMGRNTPGSGADAQLYLCATNMCESVQDLQGDGDNAQPLLAQRIDKMGPYMVNKSIQSLNSKKKKFWKEKVEAIRMMTAMCKARCCEDYIFGRIQAIIAAINRSKAGVKQIRDAAAECLECLEELRGGKSAGKGVGGVGVEEEEDNVDFHDIEGPPPIKFRPEFEPDIGDRDEEDEDEDNNDDGEEDDSVTNPEGRRKKLDKEIEGEGDNLEDAIKRGRKKYLHQRKAGGLRSPREASAGGSGAATVRLLKELGNKSVGLQRSLDDLARISADNMKGLNQRMTEVEVVVKRSGEGPAGSSQNIHQPQHQQLLQQQQQQLAKQPSEKDLFFQRQGIDHNKGVSIWREIQWLLHTDELETAYQTAIKTGNGSLVLRLMNETAVVCGRLSDQTTNQLFGIISDLLVSGSGNNDLAVLPWIFEIVRQKREGKLAPYVRDGLARALFGMISDPDEKGVLAAQLHPRIAM